jgi:hypothetical protein
MSCRRLVRVPHPLLVSLLPLQCVVVTAVLVVQLILVIFHPIGVEISCRSGLLSLVFVLSL